jgi:hypothetical protein
MEHGGGGTNVCGQRQDSSSGGQWRMKAVFAFDGRGGGQKWWWPTEMVGDVNVMSNAGVRFVISSFILLYLGKASESCKNFQEVPRKSPQEFPRSPQEVPWKSPGSPE